MVLTEWTALERTLQSCTECQRLRSHCEKIAKIKRKSYANETYWGKPIQGFGDPKGRLMMIGLAPAAHGANRTGRIFTGDRSGDWLYRALYETKFANQPHSTHRQDGLQLTDAYVTCVVKCAPPENRPTPIEQDHCLRYLQTELRLLPQTQVWIALGRIAYDQLWPLLPTLGSTQKPSQGSNRGTFKKPPFKHGLEIPLDSQKFLLLSYHPSQQNTFTGRLTRPMFLSVFERAREILDSADLSQSEHR